ncbi:thioredoxin [Candidatus Berkelbacteria bacterium CG1_02_42_45]|uniref:Thioredoxin n=2 Tax=Candidatus Berkelbacteria TaxID=1618330 RepID=A0A2M7K1Y6_9BACT|nr:MAG: thioredoxin [Candidatus Berkelbacteria bacterium CG1_02_42_45]PIX30255.1 MAG: thioredoxin [Candidatus Berkelbacteria bacterium CG_4_8_14_3_um_filter_42_13]
MGEKNLTDNNFDEVVGGKKPVLVDFWAPWCGPCQMMMPIVEEVAKETKEVVVGKVNIDENPKLAEKYNVMGVPTFLLFKEGKVVDQIVEAVSKEALVATIKKHLDK